LLRGRLFNFHLVIALSLVAAIHEHFIVLTRQLAVISSCAVGGTHWEKLGKVGHGELDLPFLEAAGGGMLVDDLLFPLSTRPLSSNIKLFAI
jgi:hypothetical protein